MQMWVLLNFRQTIFDMIKSRLMKDNYVDTLRPLIYMEICFDHLLIIQNSDITAISLEFWNYNHLSFINKIIHKLQNVFDEGWKIYNNTYIDIWNNLTLCLCSLTLWWLINNLSGCGLIQWCLWDYLLGTIFLELFLFYPNGFITWGSFQL